MRTHVTFSVLLIFGMLLWSVTGSADLPGLPGATNGDMTIGLASGNQSAPYLAAANDTALLVWADKRSNPYAYNEYETSSDIYAVRLDQDGNALESVPFAVTAARASQSNPKAAWNGTNWLVVFENFDLSGTGSYYQTGLAAVRVDAAGTVLDAQPIPIYGLSPASTTTWSVASDGNQWVVVAQGTGVNENIVAVRISASGDVLDPPTHTLVEDTYYLRFNVRLAYAGDVFLLTWDEQGQTGAVRFGSDLTVLSGPSILLGQAISSLASNGAGFYLAWQQQQPDFSQIVTGSRVSALGAVLDGTGVQISGAFPPQANNGSIAAVWDGLNWRVSWPNGGFARVATIATNGNVINPGGVAVPDVLAGITAGNGAGDLHLAWSKFADNNYDVFSATVDASAAVLANSGASTGTTRQYRGDLAAGNIGYMLVYRSTLAGQVRVLAQPLDAAGQPTTLDPLELYTGTNLSGPGSPAVAWNGSVYLVSWGAPEGILAQRLAANGAAIDAIPFLVMNPGFGAVDVAALGSDFFVAGFRYGITTQLIVPIGARVSGTGTVMDTNTLQLGDFYTQYSLDLAVTALNDRWLAVWHTNLSHDNPQATTRARFIGSDGVLSDAFQVHPTFSTAGGNGIFSLAVASDGTDALIVQSQELTSGVETDLLMHLIHGDGTVDPMVNLTPWIGNQYSPQLSFNGSDYVLVYQDQKNRLAPHSLDQLDARSDIYGIRITSGGTVVDTQGFLVADSALGETDPNVASNGSDTLILASQMRNDVDNSAYRLKVSDIVAGTNRFPVAVAGASATSGDAPLTVNFNSTGSHDPEGGAISYLWQFDDGTSSTAASPVHAYNLPGEYLALLTVYDSLGQTATQGITINATKVNQLPVANAAANRYSGPVPLSVELYADNSYDPDGHTGNIEWREGGALVSYNATAYYSTNVVGEHTLTLRVYDSRGDYGEDTVIIEALGAAQNVPPTAMANATPSNGNAPLNVVFNSAGSNDSDGSIVSYLWDFGDGSTTTSANPSHLYTSIGTYTAMLTVTDNSGASASASVVINVTGLSATALITAIDMSTSTKRKVRSANAVVSVTNGIGGTEQSAIVHARWTLPDGSTLTRSEYSNNSGRATFTTTAAQDGVYGFEIFSVTKSGFAWAQLGSETSDSIMIGSPVSNQGPTAAFTESCTLLSCGFDSSASSDPDGSIVSWQWSFGDSTTGSGAGPSHTYTTAGTYAVTLTVTDNQGSTGSASHAVTVASEPPATVFVHIGNLAGSTTAGSRGRWNATVTITVLAANGSSVQGATVSGNWGGGANGLDSCVTGLTGQCEVSKSNLKSNVSQVTFTVNNISGTGMSYDGSSNQATTISVNQP